MFYEYGVRMVIIGAYSVKRTYIYIYLLQRTVQVYNIMVYDYFVFQTRAL